MAVKRSSKLLLIAGIIGLVAWVIIGSIARVERTCELCIEFEGQTQCRRGAGATDEEAISAATMAACGVMAFGMDQSIACQNRPPRSQRCTGT